MMYIRKSDERGQADHGWLKAKHTFSFSSYYDDRFLGFRDLRVINEDQVLGGGGFPTHSHKNMEIVTYILEGSLEHKDSMGTGSVIRPGDVQYMSAASGVSHSEFNHSKTDRVHLLQIWILPEHQGGEPRYDQKHFDERSRLNQFRLLVSRDGSENSISVRQDVKLFGTILEPSKSISYSLTETRHAWLQLAKGAIEVNGERMDAGDGMAFVKESNLEVKALEKSEFLLFDLA